LITRIRLPRTRLNPAQYARKVGTRKAQAISKVCFAAVADFNDGVFRHVRIAVASVAPVPLRCIATEKLLEHENLSPALIARAKQVICQEIRPITDIRSTDRYRSSVTANLLGEFLESMLDS
jgi:CO/xanthine dehydrogenase FAD-binding subunit